MADQVDLFVTCLVDQFSPETGEAVVSTLRDASCDVRFNINQTCCGQPAINMGHLDEARRVAGRTLDLYQGTNTPIVVPSGSCAATMKHQYPRLFSATARHDEATRFANRVVEWSRYLVARDHRPPRTSKPRTVTIHPACHGLRELGVRSEPITLLERAGHRVVPLPRAESCCGFGGAFSVLMPEMSGAMLRDKLDAIEESCADVVASLDTGCLMHMNGAHQRRAACPRYVHVAQLIAGGNDHGPSSP